LYFKPSDLPSRQADDRTCSFFPWLYAGGFHSGFYGLVRLSGSKNCLRMPQGRMNRRP
jgi:hypothetical protein